MVNVSQIPAAISTIATLQQQLNSLGALLNKAQTLASGGWVVNIGDSNNPINVTVTPAQQASLVSAYDTIKATVVTTFQQLP